MILSCSNSKKTTDITETTGPVEIESEEWNEQSEDHYAIWQMDSTNEVNFITYDLAAMQVHGHVKRIVEEGGNVARFDENGNLIAISDMYSDFMIGHNDDGCLTTYAVGAGSVTYSINPETDQLVCFSGGEGSSSWVNWYKYDDKGQLIEIEYNIEDLAEETTETTTSKVKILETDQHNNWIKIDIADKIIERTIYYYPNALCDEDDSVDESFQPLSQAYSFIGKIGEDNNCTLNINEGQGTYTVAVGERIITVDSYDYNTGKLTILAYFKTKGNALGRFEGVYKDGEYSGVFTNTKGGQVNFNLIRK